MTALAEGVGSGTGPRPLAESEKSASPVDLNSSSRSARQDHLDQLFALLGPTGRERRHPQVAVHPGPRGEPTLMCKSDAPCSTT